MKVQKMLIPIILLAATSAFATGGEGTGGGDGLICIEKGSSEEKTYLLDTYELSQKGQLKGIKPIDPIAVISGVAKLIAKVNPEKIYDHPFKRGEKVDLAFLFVHRFYNLSFEQHYKERLRDLPDDNVRPDQIPVGCRKVQLAIQFVNNYSVHLDPAANKMDWLQQGLLNVHETFISLRNQPGADTTPVRGQVALFADLLSNPRYSLRNLAAQIMNPKLIPPHGSTSGWGSDMLFKHCRSMLSDVKPQPGDTQEQTICRGISRQVIAEENAEDRARAIPTVLALPWRMTCKTAHRGKNFYDWINPGTFQLVRITGSGLSGKQGRYIIIGDPRIGWGRHQTNLPALYTNRHRREGGFADWGVMDFRSSWQTIDGYDVTVFLSHFMKSTQVFYGSIQLIKSGDRNYDRYSSYGISCFGGDVPLGLDFENSNAG